MPRLSIRLPHASWGLLCLMVASAHAQSSSPAEACAISGDRFDWTTGYCLALNQTDHETLAGPCIDQEVQRRFVHACVGVTYYKQALCVLAAERGSVAGSVDACMADGGFSGPTVRRKLAVAGPASTPSP